MLAEYMETLQKRAIALRLSGSDVDPEVSIEYLVHDKRKRTKAVRELLAKGYLEPHGEVYRLTTRPWDVIEPHEPPLVTLTLPEREQPYTDYDLERRPGHSWETLPLGAKKWVIEHPNDYRLFTFDPGWPHKEPREYVAVGEVESSSFSLYLTNDTLDEELAARRYNLRFETARNQNLAWGLLEQGFIEAVDADIFAQCSSRALPFGHGSAFHHDPSVWKDEMSKAIAINREQIAKLTRATNVLCGVKDGLHNRGGWEKFLYNFEKALHESLKKDDEEEECSD